MKRFYKDVTVTGDGPFGIALDGRPVKTPGKNALEIPVRALAEAVAGEWDAQGEEVNPQAMPLTRFSNTVVDGVIANREAVAAEAAQFGASDLLYYRADGPPSLVVRESKGWDPVIKWANGRYGLQLCTGTGIAYIEQRAEDVAALAAEIHVLEPWTLAGVHQLVQISGSLLLALAVFEGQIDPDSAFHLSRIDEDYEAEKWGEDDEAATARANRYAAFLDASHFISLVRL